MDTVEKNKSGFQNMLETRVTGIHSIRPINTQEYTDLFTGEPVNVGKKQAAPLGAARKINAIGRSSMGHQP